MISMFLELKWPKHNVFVARMVVSDWLVTVLKMVADEGVKLKVKI